MKKLILVAAIGCGLGVSVADAAPITSNNFASTAPSANPSTLGSGNTVSANGVTFSGGGNSNGQTFPPDQSYIDIPGAITLSFADPVSGLGFDFYDQVHEPDRLGLLGDKCVARN